MAHNVPPQAYNEYLVHCCAPLRTGKFPWKDLHSDVQGKILRKAGLRLVYERRSERLVPLSLRPPLLPADRGHPWADTTQRLVIERPRHDIAGHGPADTLTVRWSERVHRDWYGFNHRGTAVPVSDQELGYDRDAVCRAMDIERTWTDVFKIRLVGNDNWRWQEDYDILLVRRDVHGGEEVVCPALDGHLDRSWALHSRVNKEEFARRLVQELQLTRRTVAGCDEFTC
jgi:hypothetical protein